MSQNPSSPILKVESLSKQYKSVQAVDNISFEVCPGDVFAFLGPNGAGKTTTLRILLDIIKADTGSISWNLDGIPGNLPAVSRLGYLPEERGLYGDIPVIRSLVYLASIRGMEPAKAKLAAMEWLERLELADRAKEKLQTLSKGNQQKVQFVAAILHKPDFAILDEPFSGLDPVNQEKFLEYIQELKAQGTTILLSAHQMALVEKIAGKVFLINRGRELYNGPLRDIYDLYGRQHLLKITFRHQADSGKLSKLDQAAEVTYINERQCRISLQPGADLNATITDLARSGEIEDIETQHPDLHEIYLHLVKNHQS